MPISGPAYYALRIFGLSVGVQTLSDSRRPLFLVFFGPSGAVQTVSSKRAVGLYFGYFSSDLTPVAKMA